MKQQEAKRWQSEVLDEVFEALAASPDITSVLVFKGARVLIKRLDSAYRQSADIDSNMSKDFSEQYPERQNQADYLQEKAYEAIKRHFEAQDPVQYQLQSVKAQLKPRSNHPLGWNAIELSLEVKDARKLGVRGLPRLTIDVAAPEELLSTSVTPLLVGGNEVRAYTLERLAGEKLRAFLSSLPAYQKTIQRSGGVTRVKDIYDLAVVSKHKPLDDVDFWLRVSKEFQTACRSRFISCTGIQTFEENLSQTQQIYNSDPTLPKDVSFDDAWTVLTQVINLWQEHELFPLICTLPE